MFGKIVHEENKGLKDLSGREFATLLPLLILIFWIGIYPKPFLDTMEASVVHVLDQAGAPVTAPAPAEDAGEHSLLLNDGTRLDVAPPSTHAQGVK
jgi:NADH-quinone oxidoreductase subunit M